MKEVGSASATCTIKGLCGTGCCASPVVSYVTVSGTVSVVSVALDVSAISFVFAGVVLQVVVSACGSTASERGFLLVGISSVGGKLFRFWC